MENKTVDLKSELRRLRIDYGLLKRIPCSAEKNKEYEELLKNGGVLPEGVFAFLYEDVVESKTEFYTVCEPNIPEAEYAEYLTYKKLGFLKTIKNCVLFFTVLTVISLVVSFLAAVLG